MLQISAVPAVAVLVGFISLGDCVVQVVSFVDASVQPIKKVMVVPAATAPPESTVQVIEGAETVNEVQVLVPSSLYEIFAAALPEVKPLNANVEADAEAEVSPEPGKVIMIFPEAGTGFGN